MVNKRSPGWTPDANYVWKLLMQLQREQFGFQKKVDEIERLRYGEDVINLIPSDKPTGIEIRSGLTAELIENVKAAITSNPPRVKFKPHRDGDTAQTNSSKREKFWNAYLRHLNRPVPVLSEFADAHVGLGLGILKSLHTPWPTPPRKRKKNEGTGEYNARQRALKKQWGLPYTTFTIHPLTYFPRIGPGDKVVESIEYGWKPKADILEQYPASVPDLDTNDPEVQAMMAGAISGQPDAYVRPMPQGISTETMCLVMEYWNPKVYQVYINRQLVWEEEDPSVRYFLAIGRSSSSRDPDKFGLSVADILRQNEPIINRALTRMAEATELLVRKRLTVELPEGSIADTQLDENNDPRPREFKFTPEAATALPAGGRIADPFAGVEAVYGAMPFLQLILQLTAQHGVSPIFKGTPPGASGSGYRDNSLYLMARSQFQYILDAYGEAIAEHIRWLETRVPIDVKQQIWCDEYELTPQDITDFPCTITVSVEPLLPQNLIAEGQFWSRMHAEGHITQRRVREEGLGIEAPDEEEFNRLLEDLQEALKPTLFQDVLQTVISTANPQTAPQGSGLVDQNGNPLAPSGQQGPGGVQQLMAALRANGQTPTGTPRQNGVPGASGGQSMGGYTRAGQSRQPPEEAGSLPGVNI